MGVDARVPLAYSRLAFRIKNPSTDPHSGVSARLGYCWSIRDQPVDEQDTPDTLRSDCRIVCRHGTTSQQHVRALDGSEQVVHSLSPQPHVNAWCRSSP